MANQCYNKLSIRGNMKKVDDLLNTELNIDKEDNCSNITGDNNQKWIGDIHIDNIDNGKSIHFTSRWVPPYEWLQYLTEKYNDLDFILSCNEPMMEIKGYIKTSKGKLITNKILPYKVWRYTSDYYFKNPHKLIYHKIKNFIISKTTPKDYMN